MKPKTICTVFVNHRDEIFALCQSPAQFQELKIKINEILELEELNGNYSLKEAKNYINKYENKYNSYITTLMTYMTCIPVSYNKN